MPGNYRFEMDTKDTVRILETTVGSFIQDRLLDKEQRAQHKEQCAERLAAEDGSSANDSGVRYSDQAVLANLDWGIEALEEAIDTSNPETKMARLDYAEKMLQVCAMLNSDQRTAGVPNFYLSAWAHLNLSYLWKLRDNVQNMVVHVLEMFIVDPFFSRVDFAPELWKELFLPHMSSIVGWYSEARQRLMMGVIPDSSDLSFTADLDQFFNESVVFSLRPDQLEKLQELEQVYGDSLNENTRLFAKHYKDCITSDSSSPARKKMVPMLPIAEPPMTPVREVSRSIPDYVKFGPILPKSAGFSPVLRPKDSASQTSRRSSVSSTKSHYLDLEEPAILDPHVRIPEEEVDDYEDDDDDDDDVNEQAKTDSDTEESTRGLVTLRSMKISADEDRMINIQEAKAKSERQSPKSLLHLDSRRSTAPKSSGPRLDSPFRRDSTSMLRFLTTHVKDCTSGSSLPITPRMMNNCIVSSPDSDPEPIRIAKNKSSRPRSSSHEHVNNQAFDDVCSLNGSDDGNQSCISLPTSEMLTPSRSRPPKDFICPITSQLFNDPVTLETGQTYERKAIQEWLQRGNTTCPITRQPLSASSLPKTNYVMKRLITSWKEQYPDLAQEFSSADTPGKLSGSSLKETSLAPSPHSPFDSPASGHKTAKNQTQPRSKRFIRAEAYPSPTSVISQAALEAIMCELNPHISCLCSSEDLKECEAAVLAIAKLWKDAKGDPGVHSHLSKPAIVNGLMEILTASLNREVLTKTIYILSELIFADESVGEILTSVDSDLECLAALLKNGLAESVVLMHQLRPAFAELSSHNLVPSLVQLVQYLSDDPDNALSVMEPKDAAIAMLEQILLGGDESDQSANACSVISANGIPALTKCLYRVGARKSNLSILLQCMRIDKSTRALIASRVEVSLVLELFHSGNDSARSVCIDFLTELVQLSRRTLCNNILKNIKEEGPFSTMHTFLVYLQMAPMEKQPTIASLLLQLDLQAEPRKMSIYREEALEALLEGLRRKDFPNCQMMVLNVLLSLPGQLTLSGRSCMEAWLLKKAGFSHPYNVLMRGDRKGDNELAETTKDEEEAKSSWEKRVAFVLCNHENGSIFKALEECLKSQSLEMAKQSLIISSWLIHMLSVLPDTNATEAARKSLLDKFINVLQSSRNTEEKILAALALRTFVSDPDALEELGKYATCIYKTLRKLKKYSPLVADVLKSLTNLSSINVTELWHCSEPVELDEAANGEILSLLHLNGHLISSHSDGTMKVWDNGKRGIRIIQEVRQHSKAVTCLYVPSSGDKIYSGSLDKTIRVWAIKPNEIHCVQVHDVKEPVHGLAANAKVACFISQGTGVNVYNWSGAPKHINFNKNVKSLAMMGDTLYCGCSGYSIQEIDLTKLTSATFYSGTRNWLGKQTIYSLHTHGNLLLAGGSSVDGIAGKVFSHPTRATTGSFLTSLDIVHITASNDFIFTATKCGVIEAWLKDRVCRVGSIKVPGGGHNKITSLTSDMDGGMLYAGTSDGKIQVWALD